MPFPFSPTVKTHLPAGSFVASSNGVQVTDLDGNACYDLDRVVRREPARLRFLQGAAWSAAPGASSALGPVLGAYPSLVADNVARLARISGKQEISFHMSGTEAVMQAVRLARYHTRRSHLVRFCGAYHGWWGDVQPGVGNPVPAHDTYTLAEMSDATLAVLQQPPRHRLRAGQSVAGAASQHRRARRHDPGRTAGRTGASIARPTRPG